MNATKNDHEKTNYAPHSAAPTTVTDECHMEQVESVLEYMHSISCMTIATEVRTSPSSVYGIVTTSLGKLEVCARWIPHMLNNDRTAMHVFLVTTHLQH
jgi:hypothetical protein